MKHRIRIHKAEPNTGVLDFSHLLDAPAGKHGFVHTKNGHLYFEDGTRAKFLGFNVAARSNTPDHETAEKMAARFASLGVNLIRLHAADAPMGKEPHTWSSCEQAPLLIEKDGNTSEFNPEGLERFDYFVSKLKEKGIYFHIDLLVARAFGENDGLDYPGGFPSTAKCYPTFNEGLIQKEQEYARKLLCHVNPYTGLALIDDPAVITIQLSNEESAIKGTDDTDWNPALQPYRDERQARFNQFLLAKYYTRDRLKEAWTHDGICALGEDEDPANNTVQVVSGGFYQPTNDPMGPWDAPVSPARYADYMEFGIMLNRKYYQRMKDFVISLGAKVPIACSNLVAGAADVYGHTDGDVMENNCYFNHPIPPFKDSEYTLAGPMEYVSTNPLTMQRGIGSMSVSLLSLASVAITGGKPFFITEWNEYGEHPFHSTAFVHTIAYACLNDWDGLMLYNHHTSEKWDDQPADEILSVFDAYNDPALICQWGFMASMFLKGMVSPAKIRFDVVHTQNDLRTLPTFHSMPTTYLPYIASMRNVFLDGGDTYQGNADVAVNAGFLNAGNLAEAKHGVYYAWSPYRDAWRRSMDTVRLPRAARGTKEIQPGVHLGEQALVFDNIAEVAGNGDYRQFAGIMDKALKEWGVLEEGTGYVDGMLISDTKELTFDPDNARFWIKTPLCGYFSGAPTESVDLSDEVSVQAKNKRISISLAPVAGGALAEADEYILTAIGETGMDETTFTKGPDMMGIQLTVVTHRGKLFLETLDGSITVKNAKSGKIQALNPVGEVIGEIPGVQTEQGLTFTMTGEFASAQYHLTIQR